MNVGGINMARYFSLDWTDLTFEKQQELISEIKAELIKTWAEEGQKFLQREWYDPKPKTWKEAYVRMYYLDSSLWEDWIDGKDEKEPDWDYILEEAAEKEAEDRCSKAIRQIEIEI